MNDENRFAIWIKHVMFDGYTVTIFGDATISAMKNWHDGKNWDFWAWVDEGVDE